MAPLGTAAGAPAGPSYAPAPPVQGPAWGRPMSEHDVRTWAMFCHLAAFSGLIGIPLGHILGPLLIWQIKGKADPFIEANGKASLNFQISLTIYMMAAGLLIFAVVGCVLLPAVIIFGIVVVISAAMAANEGRMYKYPWSIEFIK